MTDHRQNPRFLAKVAEARRLIAVLADEGVDDALALTSRGDGWNNLQGHLNSLLPVAVLFFTLHPSTLRSLKRGTQLRDDLGAHSAEARSATLWDPIKLAFRAMVDVRGDDIVASQLSDGAAQTVGRVAATYLSVDFGGGQDAGGAGNTVVNRALKLLAHRMLP